MELVGTGSLSWADHELAKLKRAIAELDATNNDERISATRRTAGASVHPEARRAAAEQESCVNTTLSGSAAPLLLPLLFVDFRDVIKRAGPRGARLRSTCADGGCRWCFIA